MKDEKELCANAGFKINPDKPLKVYIGDNLITDQDDWEKVVRKFSEYEMKAKAFDLLADHYGILDLITHKSFSMINMTRHEVEQVAEALGKTINWIMPEPENKEEPKKKKHWWSK